MRSPTLKGALLSALALPAAFAQAAEWEFFGAIPSTASQPGATTYFEVAKPVTDGKYKRAWVLQDYHGAPPAH